MSHKSLKYVLILFTINHLLYTGLKFAELREFKVAAGSPVGTIVGRLRVEGSGSSNEDLVYLLLNNSTDNAPHYFSLEPKTGLITTARYKEPPPTPLLSGVSLYYAICKKCYYYSEWWT